MRKVRAAVLLSLIAGGCAGNGCSCASPLPNGFPSTERHANAVQVRVTSSGVAFLEANAAAVVGGLVPGGLTFTAPESCGGSMEICCGQPASECGIAVDLNPRGGDPARLELSLAEPNQIGVVLRARVRTTDHLNITAGIDCEVRINTENQSPPSVTATMDVTLVVDGTTGTTRVEVANVQVTDFDTGDIEIGGSNFLCGLGNIDFVKDLLVDQFIGQIGDTLTSALTDQLCKTCAAPGECAPFATCDANGTCMLPSGACLQELGVSGRVLARDALGSLSPGQEGAADVYDVAGGYARVANGGLSLGVLGGAVPPDGAVHPCVPGDSPPPLPASIPESTLFQGNSGPAGAFDLGLGIHEYHLNQSAWAMYQGGVLCLNVGTRTVDLLQSQTLGLIVGSLGDLTHDDTVPVVIGLRPQKRPVLTLGAGTFNADGSILEPLITVSMPQLQMDFFALIEERYVRLFTVQADLTLPLSLDLDDTGKLVPIFGDVSDAFANLSVTNSELLSETPDELATAFPTLLQVALPFLGSALGGFDLPMLGGVTIQVAPGGITSVEGNTMLALFGTLATSAAPKRRAIARAEVTATSVPPLEAYRTLDPGRRPTVELAFSGVGADGTDRDLEWQVRVDGGYWQPYTRVRRRVLDEASFWLAGTHDLEVRARTRGRPETASEIVHLSAVLDPRPPAAQHLAGESVYFHGRVADSGCQCRAVAGGRGGDAGAIAAAIAGATLLWWSRRKRRLALALVAALAPGCNCGGDGSDCTSPSDEEVVAGTIGRFSDVAADGETVLVSAYEARYGDLVLGRRGDEGDLKWRVVDGAPAEPVIKKCDGYRGGVEEAGDDVGAWSSLAIVGDGKGMVAYQDRTHRTLKLAYEGDRADDPWTVVVVDPGPGEVGRYASLSVDAAGVPGIAYLATNLDDGMNGKRSELRWAQAAGSHPGSGDFTIETIAQAKIPCAGLCASGTACVASTDVCSAVDTSCPAACADTEACVAGACTAVRPDPAAVDLVEGTGLFASAGRLADERAVVAFYDRESGDLDLAVRDGTWSVTSLDAGPDTDTGQWASVAVAGDTVHVAYQDALGDRLLAVSWTGGTVGPIEVVDDGRREGDRPHSVGASAALVSTGGGLLVAYQDQTTVDLLVGRRDASGAWTHAPLAAGAPGFGFYASAAQGIQLWVSNYVYDRSAEVFGDLRLVNPPYSVAAIWAPSAVGRLIS